MQRRSQTEPVLPRADSLEYMTEFDRERASEQAVEDAGGACDFCWSGVHELFDENNEPLYELDEQGHPLRDSAGLFVPQMTTDIYVRKKNGVVLQDEKGDPILQQEKDSSGGWFNWFGGSDKKATSSDRVRAFCFL